jgi:hypothetical protein
MSTKDQPPGRTGEPGPDEHRNTAQEPEKADDEGRFVEDLVVRGEVVPEGTEPLPPGATHEVVDEQDGVPTLVRRRRFSAQG